MYVGEFEINLLLVFFFFFFFSQSSQVEFEKSGLRVLP